MMLNEPGKGFHVRGELYVAGRAALATLDEIESVGKPGHLRLTIEVTPVDGGPGILAFACMKARQLAEPAHSGLLATYSDRRFPPAVLLDAVLRTALSVGLDALKTRLVHESQSHRG